jgi:hypothetical protein
MYKLIANNKQGSGVVKYGLTKKEALSLFDSEFHRQGFKIEIRNTDTGKVALIKKTFK